MARGEYESVEKTWPTIDYVDAVRPDSPYGAAKVFTKAAGRWFSDAYSMSMLNIRLGVFLDTNAPKRLRHFPGFLDQMDAVRMIDACLSASETVKSDVFDAISDNSTCWRDTSHAEDVIGWKAEGSSDRFEPNDYRDQPGPVLPTG